MVARPLTPVVRDDFDDVDDGLDVARLDDLSHLRPEVRAAIELAEENIRTGKARLVPRAEMEAALGEIGRQRAAR
jgi:hypothetical protein